MGGGWLEPGQEGVVLCPEADGLPGDFVRTLRLRRWVFELGGRLEPGQEGVVLCPEADGLPRVRALRLRRGVFKLGGWMECRQEGVVLHQQEDGVQGEAWRLSIPRPIHAGYHHCMHCLVESWSPQKIDYCCKNFHKGCKGEELE